MFDRTRQLGSVAVGNELLDEHSSKHGIRLDHEDRRGRPIVVGVETVSWNPGRDALNLAANPQGLRTGTQNSSACSRGPLLDDALDQCGGGRHPSSTSRGLIPRPQRAISASTSV